MESHQKLITLIAMMCSVITIVSSSCIFVTFSVETSTRHAQGACFTVLMLVFLASMFQFQKDISDRQKYRPSSLGQAI